MGWTEVSARSLDGGAAPKDSLTQGPGDSEIRPEPTEEPEETDEPSETPENSGEPEDTPGEEPEET